MRASPSGGVPPTVIVLTWNGLAYTKACLEAIQQRTAAGTYELIVVDNGSTDGTLEYLSGLEGARVIANETNLGFSRAANIGLDAARGDAVLVNNDVVVTQDDWLGRLRGVAHSASDVGIVVCRILRPDGLLQHAGTFMSRESFRGQQVGGGEVDVGQHGDTHDVESGVAAVMYITRACRERIGGFDTSFFAYFEDTDYCLRAWDAGMRVRYTGSVTAVHHESASAAVNRLDFSSLYEASRRTFVKKWSGQLEGAYAGSVAWRSWFFRPPGYGNASRLMTSTLESLGLKVALRLLEPSEAYVTVPENDRFHDILGRRMPHPGAEICFSYGDLLPLAEGRVRVGYTMLEVDGLPSDWVANLNTMDEVWVPSSFNVATFRDSGVTAPMVAVPLGYDPGYFNPQIKSFRATDRFTFLSVFEWGERKAPEALLRAFTEEFGRGDDVQLVIKTSNRDPAVDVSRSVASCRLRRGGAPVVVDVNRDIPTHQMGALYRSADAFVFPTRGEGWAYPVLEAMACGLPVIATGWSGHTEFFDEHVGYPVEHRLVPAVAKCPYYRGFRWAEPDVDHLRSQLRHVYEHPEESARRGARAAVRCRERYSHESSALRMVERLSDLGAVGLGSPDR